MNRFIFKRLLAFYIDAFFIFILSILYLFVLTLLNVQEDNNQNNIVVYIVIMILYYVIGEYFFSRTLGKLIIGIRVEIINNSASNFLKIILRTLLRFVPLDPFSIFFNFENSMWHDKFSHTKVIEVKN